MRSKSLFSGPTISVLATAVGAMGALGAAPTVMYDAGMGTLPTSQGWAFVATPLFQAKSTQKQGNGVAILDSDTVRTDKAGWFSNLPPFGKHPAQPPLNAEAGFLVSFTSRVVTESHGTPDRAGFSVIATASNLSSIELGFWSGEIWAQSGADFHHAEGVTFDTAAALVRYDLEVKGARYRLSANGALVLQGDLRRYDSFGTPYNVPDFLFFGDDTGSAQGTSELGRVSAGALPQLEIGRRDTGITLSVAAETGREVVFEGGSEFGTWTQLASATSAGGIAKVELTTGPSMQFFRAYLR